MRGQHQSSQRRLNRHWQSGGHHTPVVIYQFPFSGELYESGWSLTSENYRKDPNDVETFLYISGDAYGLDFIGYTPSQVEGYISASLPGDHIRYTININMPAQWTDPWTVPLVKVKTDIGDINSSPRGLVISLNSDPNVDVVYLNLQYPGGSIGSLTAYNVHPKTGQIVLDYIVATNDGMSSALIYPFTPIISSRSNSYTAIDNAYMRQQAGGGNYYDHYQASYISGIIEILR